MFIATFKDKAFLKCNYCPSNCYSTIIFDNPWDCGHSNGCFERGSQCWAGQSNIHHCGNRYLWNNGGYWVILPILRGRNYENIRKSMALMIIIVFIALFFNLLAFFSQHNSWNLFR